MADRLFHLPGKSSFVHDGGKARNLRICNLGCPGGNGSMQPFLWSGCSGCILGGLSLENEPGLGSFSWQVGRSADRHCYPPRWGLLRVVASCAPSSDWRSHPVFMTGSRDRLALQGLRLGVSQYEVGWTDFVRLSPLGPKAITRPEGGGLCRGRECLD